MRARSLTRLGTKFRILIWIISAVIVAAVVVFFVFSAVPSVPRVTVVIASSPISVWSCDLVTPQCVVVSLPSSDVVDATHGLGRYSLDALWRLGFIDKRGGAILAESASNALGLSGAWYVGGKSDVLPNVSDSVSYGKKLLTIANGFRFMVHAYDTNMPLSVFWALAREIPSLRFDQIVSVDLSNKQVTSKEVLPDGSTQEVLDSGQVDTVLGGMFEDTAVRTEALATAVYNTTAMPNLGTNAARLLSTLGVLVVSVGNKEPEQKTCTVSGNRVALSSKTAHIIRSVLNCVLKESSVAEPADLSVFVGSDFETKYSP